jgi:TolB-like protein/Flp pilus assembly protein TadD
MSFFTELKRRKVFRVAVVYAATAFAVLQVADIMLPQMNVPEWAMSLLVAFIVLGFPIALVLAWALEVTPDGGVQRTEADAASTDAATPLLGKRTLLAAALLVAIGIGLSAGWLLKPGSSLPPGPATVTEADADPITGDADAAETSIAVLPFADLSPERDHEYFSDGLAEEILNLLASVQDLSVASRTSAFSFKGSGLPIPEIAEQLDVNFVLEGSVRKAGERIRVTAQLIDARSDRHLWSKNYDRDLADIFAVQDEIAAAIGEALQVELLGAGGRKVASEALDPEIYEQFLQARFLLRQRNDVAIAASRKQLEAVVEAAPGFARALALLAEAYMLGNNAVADPRAGQLVQRALAIDPNLGSAIMVRGNIASLRGDPLAAYTDYQRAIELAPEEPRPYHWLAIVYTLTGYRERAEQAIARAAELEPGNANIRGWQSVLLARRGARELAVSAALEQARLGNPIGHVQAALYLLDSDSERAAEQLRLAEAAGMAEAPPLKPLIRIARGESDQIEPFVQSLRSGEVDEYLGTAGLLALDLDEVLLQELDDLDPGYGAMPALFWTDANAPLRADPRFIRFMQRKGAFPLWRALGPPPDCRAEGDGFTCGHGYPPAEVEP